MLGAIIGDIAGSRFERRPYKKKDFELFTKDCRVTDDSITTIAVAKAMMETEKAIGSREKNGEYYRLLEKLTVQYLQEYGRKYPDSGFGGMFYQWIFSSHPKPYNSFGNGAAMRISPAGFAANTEKEALRLSDVITGVTHNHEEGLKGAKATASLFIWRETAPSRKKSAPKFPASIIRSILPWMKFAAHTSFM